MIYGYIRVSTDKQTVENQRLEIETWAKKRGFKIEKWIEETISGTQSYKVGKFRSLVKKTLVKGDILIISELSRMSRNLMEIMEVLKHLMEHEIAVKTVKEGYELGDTITSKVLAFAFGLSAEIERTLISERTKAGLKKRVEEGVILGRPAGSGGVRKLQGRQDEIKKLLESGMSVQSAAKFFGVHRETMRQFCIAYDLYKPKTRTNLYYITHKGIFDDYYDEICSMIHDGLSYVEMGSKLIELYGIEFGKGAVRQFLKRRNLYDTYVDVQLKKREKANKGVDNARTA